MPPAAGASESGLLSVAFPIFSAVVVTAGIAATGIMLWKLYKARILSDPVGGFHLAVIGVLLSFFGGCLVEQYFSLPSKLQRMHNRIQLTNEVSPEDIDVLFDILQDPDLQQRLYDDVVLSDRPLIDAHRVGEVYLAVTILCEIARIDDSVVWRLIWFFEDQTQQSSARQLVGRKLGQLGDARAVYPLLQYLLEQDYAIEKDIGGYHNGIEKVGGWVPRQRIQDYRWRSRAITIIEQALYEIGSASISLLSRALIDRSLPLPVRLTCAKVLLRLRPDDEWVSRQLSNLLLERLGFLSARFEAPFWREWYPVRETLRRGKGVRGLTRPYSYVSRYVERFPSVESNLSPALVRTLKEIGNPAIKALESILRGHENETIRRFARAYLDRITE